ncbi:MAG: methylated-DNA--[protein]-cysteine S-methyltransferase [Phycisphaerales bacterium]
MREARTVIECPAGRLVIGRREGALVADWSVSPRCVEPAAQDDSEAVDLADALRRALAGDESRLARFPVGAGTAFQRRVWSACRQVPRGRTQTYGGLAKGLGLGMGGARAVGQALRRNPLPVLVPCHRIVAVHGQGGYSGETAGALAQVKKTLLDLERSA